MIVVKLDFIKPNYGVKEIDWPEGLDGAEFIIEQGDGRLGRDVTAIGSGNSSIRLNPRQEHYFEEMLYANRRYGVNADVKFILEIDGTESYRGQVDFPSAETDNETYFEFIVLDENERLKLKRAADINTNLFSNKDLDENDITPCATTNVLMLAKPIVQISQWSNPTIGQEVIQNNPIQNPDYFNVIKKQDQYDIQNSLTWLSDYLDSDNGAFKNFIFIEAQSNLKNVKIEFNLDAIYKYRPTEQNALSDHNGQILIRAYYGQSATSGNYTQVQVWNSNQFTGNSDQDQTLPTYLSATIPFVNNTDKVWISFVSATKNGAVNRVKFNECTIKITATSIAYNTVVPMVRLVDAMRYNVLSSSGLPISAPRWEFGGQFYDQFITTQPLMRNLLDKPFNWSFKGITEGYFPEVFGDYQIQADNTVLFGIYEDFYRDYEIGSYKDNNFGFCFDVIQGFKKILNKVYSFLKFGFKYSNYASTKETELDNTYDAVHAETEWYNRNISLEDNKDIEVETIRDAFYIEESRRKAYDLSDTAATQDDDKIYMLDVVELQTADRYFTETAPLKHEVVNGLLKLTNTGAFSWILLGISSGTPFTILLGGNIGNYGVSNVTDTTLLLLPYGGVAIQNIADQNTTFQYYISPSVTSKVIRTDEGFNIIENISDGRNYANLRFSAKRNIINYYSKFLATASYYFDVADADRYRYINSLYKNNPDAITQLTGSDIIKEGDNFYAASPILTPDLYDVVLIMTLQDFLDLMVKQRQYNGYITVLDTNELPIKGYIKKAVWIFKSAGANTADTFIGEVKATIEEKYQQFLLEIIGLGEGSIILNSEITVNDFDFEIDSFENLIIFGETGEQVFPAVPYDRVRVGNGGPFTSAALLAQTLNNL